ncbi:hypothetical protein KBY55_32265 [Streptomyces sp. b94]|nr:hypothetical protein [Streptomyces sp. b94]
MATKASRQTASCLFVTSSADSPARYRASCGSVQKAGAVHVFSLLGSPGANDKCGYAAR